jgi:hypothetical protein
LLPFPNILKMLKLFSRKWGNKSFCLWKWFGFWRIYFRLNYIIPLTRKRILAERRFFNSPVRGLLDVPFLGRY